MSPARRSLALAFALPCVLVALLLGGAAPAHADEQRAFVKAMPDEATWTKFSKRIGSDQLGKFIIDVNSNELYFIDVNLFNIHADFVLGVLLTVLAAFASLQE